MIVGLACFVIRKDILSIVWFVQTRHYGWSLAAYIIERVICNQDGKTDMDQAIVGNVDQSHLSLFALSSASRPVCQWSRHVKATSQAASHACAPVREKFSSAKFFSSPWTWLIAHGVSYFAFLASLFEFSLFRASTQHSVMLTASRINADKPVIESLQWLAQQRHGRMVNWSDPQLDTSLAALVGQLACRASSE